MKTVLFILSCLIFSSASVCQGALIYWNANTAAATSISGSDAGGIASAVFSDPAVNQFGTPVTLIDASSPSSAYTGASGANNFQAKAKVGALSILTSTYFSVILTPSGGFGIQLNSISLGSRSTGTGPTAITLYSSIDSFNTSIGSAVVAANSSWALSSINFSGGSLTGAADSPITFRIYGSDGTGSPSSANWRIDDINLSITAVPEPINVALGIFGGLFAIGLCVKRYKSKEQPVS